VAIDRQHHRGGTAAEPCADDDHPGHRTLPRTDVIPPPDGHAISVNGGARTRLEDD
jgi:hypothetical protein